MPDERSLESEKDGVICALDVNDFDQDVVDLAATFADQFGVGLNLVHVTLSPDPGAAAWPAFVDTPDKNEIDRLRLLKINTNVEVAKLERQQLSGDPSTCILGMVETLNPRLLVLGTHGRTGLARIMGSVASRILREARCPVVVLRQKQNTQEFADLLPANE